MQETLNGVIDVMISILAPLLALVVAVAVMAHFFQFGFLFAFESIKPDIKKLNPVKGIKKIFSMKNLIEFIKSII